ncbi:MAG TPA: M14 family zinc carboxypeptidase [Solirubrobacterales bacterium]
MKAIGKSLLIALLAAAAIPASAQAKGLETMSAINGVAPPWSPYRYVAMAPRHPAEEGRTTTLAQIDREGGAIDRWWFLRGHWMTPAFAYDGSGGGLSADGGTLVLAGYRYAYPRPNRWSSRFAIVDTDTAQGFDPARRENLHPVTRITLEGDLKLAGVSPDGETVYLNRYPRPGYPAIHAVQALDVASGKLRPAPVSGSRNRRDRLEGLPVTATSDRQGRWAYTLYGGNGEAPYLQALDTEAGRVVDVRLPHLADETNPMLMKMRLDRDGDKLLISPHGTPQGEPARGPQLSVDTRTFAVRRLGDRFLSFTETPRRPGNLLGRSGTIGRSREGKPIELHQVGDPRWSGELLVFGCIHGDECGASQVKPLTGGCPDPSADIFLVPNLDPDGAAAGSRLNGDGVDLNRNFGSEWQPIGNRWDPEYSGPRPFSEPESRLAARIIARVRPAATIWLHQFRGERPFVRAWGQSLAAARHFARLARMPFRSMRWPRGTGPNWQNHAFPDAAFVVELPRGRLEPAMRSRLSKSLVRMGRWVRED